MREYQMCTRCVMDTTDPNIIFDSQGVCNHCTTAIEFIKGKTFISETEREKAFQRVISTLKESGKGRKYDCVAGLSGGVDSTYVICKLVENGVRVLAVHLDNDFNSAEAEENIKRCVEAMNVDLLTVKVDMEQYADAIVAYIKSGVANCEAVTDNAIHKVLYGTADKNNIEYIVTGHNATSESIGATDWGHSPIDKKNIIAILNRYGTKPHDKLDLIDIKDLIYYRITKKVKKFELLNYLDYDKEKAKAELAEKIGWKNYGEKHGESIWTRFFQWYYLPKRFGHDKRKWYLSSLICVNQLSREDALLEISKPAYSDENLLNDDINRVCKVLGITVDELNRYMEMPTHDALEFPNNQWLIKLVNAHNTKRATKGKSK